MIVQLKDMLTLMLVFGHICMKKSRNGRIFPLYCSALLLNIFNK